MSVSTFGWLFSFILSLSFRGFFTCFVSDCMLQCMCIYFILPEKNPKLCRMTKLGRKTSLYVFSGLYFLSGWNWCVDFARQTSVAKTEFQFYEIMREDGTKTAEMKCYMPGDIQRNRKWETYSEKHLNTSSSIERHSENKKNTWVHATY